MATFRIALHQSGLMEHEGREFLYDPREIEAPDLEAAKRLYARVTGIANLPHWNADRLTSWGFPLVDVAMMGDGWKMLPRTQHASNGDVLVR